MVFTKRFYKLQGSWFIDIPYEDLGISFEDCQMVEGADTFLDEISGWANEVTLMFSDEKIEGDKLDVQELTLQEIVDGWGRYLTTDHLEVNLCFVTEILFGKFPEKLYVELTK